MKIALVSCAKSKKNYKCTAKELYSPSELFSISYKYAQTLKVDKIYILSAKYGLVHENTFVDPYELSMKNLSADEQKEWANSVKQQLENELTPYGDDEYIVLTGMDYLQPLLNVKAFKKYSFPLRGMSLGKRKLFMNNEIKRLQNPSYDIKNSCLLLHKLFNEQTMYGYTEIDSIPFNNGIYIIFEKGETYKGYSRIVRVGTHTSPNRLKARLKDHYISKNKDGSIFRKNIGKAILNQRNDAYLSNWNVDTSKPANKHYINYSLQAGIEDSVSTYLQENTFFTVFEVTDLTERMRLESGIIATLNNDESFKKSVSWLGNYSTEHEIVNSGMWLKKGLNDRSLSGEELNMLIQILDGKKYSYTQSNKENNICIDRGEFKFTTDFAVAFIKNILIAEQDSGKSECILVSGDIGKQIGVKQRTRMICRAMRKDMGFKYEILYAPPKGDGTRLKIKYYL